MNAIHISPRWGYESGKMPDLQGEKIVGFHGYRSTQPTRYAPRFAQGLRHTEYAYYYIPRI